MGVAADDEVDASRVLSHRNVDVVPDVSHSNDALDVLVGVDIISPILYGLDWVGEGRRVVRVGDSRNGVGGDSDYSELVLGEDVIWLGLRYEHQCVLSLRGTGPDRRVDAFVLTIYICANNRHGKIVELCE